MKDDDKYYLKLLIAMFPVALVLAVVCTAIAAFWYHALMFVIGLLS